MAGREILAAVDDLFFAVKLESTARNAGVNLVITRTAEEAIEELENRVPDLVILDLNSAACRPLELIRHIRADERLERVPALGFYSHVQAELEHGARAAGCDVVMPRSRFSSRLADILLQGPPMEREARPGL